MKNIIGYENLYSITKDGKIFSQRANRYIKSFVGNAGYHRVGFNIKGKKSNHSIHRLVAMTFLDNPENKPQVNHINGIKTDNRVENLEWVSSSENQKHAALISRFWEKGIKLATIAAKNKKSWKIGLVNLQKANEKSQRPIIQCDLMGNKVAEYKSIQEAARTINKNGGAIHRVLTGQRTKLNNFAWKYA